MAAGYNDNMSPDSVSSLFPDRPIRPLPKRRLRERLSPDVADTITYPPAPQNSAPLFHYPYSLKEEAGTPIAEHRGPGWVDTTSSGRAEAAAELAQETGSRRNGAGGEHEDRGLAYQPRRALVSRPLHDSSGHSVRTPQRSSQARHAHPQAPPSTASSADGYDSFENTNNKKKRKIPTAGEAGSNGAHVLSDASILGIPSPPATGDEAGDASGASPTPYYQTGGNMANAQGISGPGRGRYGRVRNGRSPLRALPDPNASWTGRNPKMRPGGQYPSSPTGENAGIISTAIATAEKLTAPQGQENISLLQQQASSKSSPASSQFTFTFDSQVPGTVSWPGSDPAPPHMTGASHPQQGVIPGGPRDIYNGTNVRSTQTGQPHLAGSGGSQPGVNMPGDGGGKGGAQANAPPKKSKRRNGNSLMLAAKHRRQQTEYQNYHHPPSPEEIWMCEFCEYERIFGRPPEALIRQYEIKDRRRRREEAERRRLLEKAKMKSRKGKKASKLPAKNNAAVHDRNAAPPPAHQMPHPGTEPSQETQSEEFDEDDYYEEDVHDEDCPASHHVHGVEHSHASALGHEGAAGDGHGDSGGGRDNRMPVS